MAIRGLYLPIIADPRSLVSALKRGKISVQDFAGSVQKSSASAERSLAGVAREAQVVSRQTSKLARAYGPHAPRENVAARMQANVLPASTALAGAGAGVGGVAAADSFRKTAAAAKEAGAASAAGLAQGSRAAGKLAIDMNKVTIAAERSTKVQVQGALKRDARLREEIRLLKQDQSAFARTSQEYKIMGTLAAQKQMELSRSLGVTAAESKRLQRAAGHSNKELQRGFRGALAGTGIFRSLGRALAFASGGFLIFATAASFIRGSIDAAREWTKTQARLSAQFKANKQDLGQYRSQIEQAVTSSSKLYGFTKNELTSGFILAYRSSRKVGVGLRIMKDAVMMARATGKPYQQMVLGLTKAYGGMTTALRRAGILVPAGAKGMEVLAYAERRFAGQALAGTTAAERFHAQLYNLEEAAGNVLLPTIDHVIGRLADWMGKTKNQRGVQEQFKQVLTGVGAVVKGLAKIVETFTGLFGGWSNAIQIVAVAWVALKVKAAVSAAYISAANVAASVKMVAAWKIASFQVVASQATMAGESEAAAAAMASANQVAAAETASAWRVALVSTGWGALAVAAGLAAAYVMTHWQKVKGWFVSLWQGLKLGGMLIWDTIKGAAETAWYGMKYAAREAIYKILVWMTAIPRGMLKAASLALGWVPGIGGKIKAGLRSLNAWVEGFNPNMKPAGQRAGAQFGKALGDTAKARIERAGKEIQTYLKSLMAAAGAPGATYTPKGRAGKIIGGVPTFPSAEGGTYAAPRGTPGPAPPRRHRPAEIPTFQAWLDKMFGLSAAKAAATRSTADDLQVARAEEKAIKRAIRLRLLHGKELVAAYQELGNINAQLAGDVKKAADFGERFDKQWGLSIAKASATVSGADDLSVAKQARAWVQRQIASGKLNREQLTNAYSKLADLNGQIASAAQQAADKAKQARDALVQRVSEAMDQMGQLFAGPILQPSDTQIKTMLGFQAPDMGTINADIRAQNAATAAWLKDIRKLIRAGAPKQLIKELIAAGPEQAAYVHRLATASKKQLQAYFKAYQERARIGYKVATVKMTARNVDVIARAIHIHGGSGVKKMAAGGIVTRPTVALIGEAGPEAVIPLKRHRGRDRVPQVHDPGYVENYVRWMKDWSPTARRRYNRFGLYQSGNYIGIPTRRFQEPWFEKDIGRGVSRAMMGDIEKWWERAGFFQQRGYRRAHGLPMFAAGGVVTRPTYGLVGEKGPEAIIPLKRLLGRLRPQAQLQTSGRITLRAGVVNLHTGGILGRLEGGGATGGELIVKLDSDVLARATLPRHQRKAKRQIASVRGRRGGEILALQ